MNNILIEFQFVMPDMTVTVMCACYSQNMNCNTVIGFRKCEESVAAYMHALSKSCCWLCLCHFRHEIFLCPGDVKQYQNVCYHRCNSCFF